MEPQPFPEATNDVILSDPRRAERMADQFKFMPMPASREPVSLLSVDRAISELRRGRIIAIGGGGGRTVLAQTAEAVTPASLHDLEAMGRSQPVLAITMRRAAVLNLATTTAAAVTVSANQALTADLVNALADPLADLPDTLAYGLKTQDAPPFSCDSAAVALAKLARLLPAAVVCSVTASEADDIAQWATRHDLLLVDAGDIFQYDSTAGRTLGAVSEARVPLMDAEECRIIAFRPLDGGVEHLAIVIGTPEPDKPVLTRIHSECFTGDLLGSLRCDCGDQLRGAITEISATGAGILLYLAQEGRGIGLVNKLRAYQLQDRGFDTLDANEQLGFDADERVYIPAARMLRQLGFSEVRLLTNNPEKVAGLARWGLDIVERVAHTFASNKHNETYLKTKATRGGHSF
jgi:GTP cyclohydrolase II